MELQDLALEQGFEDACAFDPALIVCRQAIRDICTNGLCPMPGTNWSCPPGCGDLEDRKALISGKQAGVVVQTVRRDFDYMDLEAIAPEKEEHDQRLHALSDALTGQGYQPLVLTSGGCGLCASCTYPEPCIKPDERWEAISASGIDLDELCPEIGMEYSFEQGTLRLVSIVLI